MLLHNQASQQQPSQIAQSLRLSDQPAWKSTRADTTLPLDLDQGAQPLPTRVSLHRFSEDQAIPCPCCSVLLRYSDQDAQLPKIQSERPSNQTDQPRQCPDSNALQPSLDRVPLPCGKLAMTLHHG